MRKNRKSYPFGSTLLGVNDDPPHYMVGRVLDGCWALLQARRLLEKCAISLPCDVLQKYFALTMSVGRLSLDSVTLLCYLLGMVREALILGAGPVWTPRHLIQIPRSASRFSKTTLVDRSVLHLWAGNTVDVPRVSPSGVARTKLRRSTDASPQAHHDTDCLHDRRSMADAQVSTPFFLPPG
jgi:hypothetical protein